jgi:hypothetical protein
MTRSLAETVAVAALCTGFFAPAPAAGVAIPIDPGPHPIVVKAPGRADAEVTVEAREGQVVKRSLSPGAPARGAGATPPPPEGEGASGWTGKRVAGVASTPRRCETRSDREDLP